MPIISPLHGNRLVYRGRAEILQDMIEALTAKVPDAYIGEDGNLRLFFEVNAAVIESVFLSMQILREDLFVHTANFDALKRHGEQFGKLQKIGTKATGELLFEGVGGTLIDVGRQVAYDPGEDQDFLYYSTVESGTIPNPGIPTAPTAADGGAGAIEAGTYEYKVTFTTAEGETLPGFDSNDLIQAVNKQISVTNIPLGGPGTIARKLYRQKDGGGYKLVPTGSTLNNNTTTSLTDNNNAAAMGAAPPTVTSALRVRVDAESMGFGEKYNAIPGSIVTFVNVPEGILTVTNPLAFAGGGDQESMEEYRARVVNELRAPHTGSSLDLKNWAEENNDVETAAVFENDNLGTPQNGHTTVRISGPGGAIPTGSTVAAVEEELKVRIPSSLSLHVGTFTAVTTAVTVVITLDTGYVLTDVQPSVENAITDYINSVPVGGTVYRSGIIDAIFGLPGIIDITVTTPAANQTTTGTQKRTPGTISVGT